jgi:YHS domain-containing protein
MLALLVTAALLAAPTPKPSAPKPPINTKCPACGGALLPKSPRITVRGQEYFVCCTHCGASVEKDPDKYLEKDGTPKKR